MSRLEKQRSLALTILATICITYFVENFLRSAASALTPVLIQELGISRGAMGFLITGMFLIYGIMQFPAGLLTEILGPRKSIIWFTALTVVGGVLFWLSYRYELLLIAQFTMGVGTSVFYINAISIISRWFPRDKKATAVGILSATTGIGAFTSYMGFPLATVILGSWRILYFAMLCILALNWAMNFLILKDSPNATNSTEIKRQNILQAYKETLLVKRLHPLIFGYIMMGFNFILFQWVNQFMIESKKLTYLESGMVASVGTVAGFLGCLAMGTLSDRLGQRRLPVIFSLGVYTLLLSILIITPVGSSVLLYVGIWGTMSVFSSVWVLFPSMVGEVVSPSKASLGFGTMNGLMMILSSIATPLYGSLVDITGSFFIPTIISLGISIFTLSMLFVFLKETYSNVIKD